MPKGFRNSDGMPLSRKRKKKALPKAALENISSKRRSEAASLLAYRMMEDDPMTWGQMFFPKHFRMESPEFHYSLIDTAHQAKHFAVAAPRGSAKSTLLAFLYPFHQIVFQKRRFIVILSNTFKKAAMHLDTIKKELQDNHELNVAFPKIYITKDAEGDSEFKHVSGFEIKVLCKGVDQLGSIRGVKFRAYRPDLIIIDDLEDDELVKNPDRRRELQDQFDEVLNQVGDKTTKFVMVGTILHDDCQLAKMVSPERYPEFRKIILKAHLDPDTPSERSLWPEKWSVEYLRQLREEKKNVYAKEMQNDPVAGLNARFLKEDFRYWRESDGDYVILDSENQAIARGSLKNCKGAIACDLAWSEKRDSDYCVLLPGYLTPENELLIEDYAAKRGMKPDSIAEQLYLMASKLAKKTGTSESLIPVGFEKSMLENVTKFLLRNEMKKRNRFLMTKELVWDHDKAKRIEIRLSARYSQHVIFHKHGMGELEHQLERFPYGAHDDLVDAMQGLVQLLQYPKEATTKKVDTTDQFEWWRQQTIQKKSPWKGYTGKQRWVTIPAKRAWN